MAVELKTTASQRVNRILSAARRAIRDNVRTRGAMATPPTVTRTTTEPAGLTVKYRVTTTIATPPTIALPLPPWREMGAIATPILHATAYNRYPVAKPGTLSNQLETNGQYIGGIWRVTAIVDSIKFGVLHGGYAAKYRYAIDGVYVDPAGYVGDGGTGSPTSSQACWDVLDFTSAGGRKPRVLTIEGAANQSFGGIWVAPTEKVSAPGAAPVSALFIGDSLFNGVGATQGYDGMASVIADYMGIEDFVANGVPSSGYVATTGGLLTYGGRIADYSTRSYDMIVAFGGFNDVNTGQSAASVQAALSAFIPQLRAVHPTTPIVILGVWPGQTGPSANWITMENAISAGVTAAADPFTAFVPICTDPLGSWIDGTGKVGATTGSGNADVMISADGIHPPDFGHSAFAVGRAVPSIMKALATLG